MVLLQATASLELFMFIVGIGIAGAVIVGTIIITYTVIEFRRKEIW